MAGAERADVLVSLQRETGQIVHQTFTSSRGTFFLDGVSLFSVSNNNPYYLVINEDGYKPYRRRLQQLDFRGGGSIVTVYLEPESPAVTAGRGGDGEVLTVDLRQLQAEIPGAALREYDASLEASESGNHDRAVLHLERAVDIAPDFYDAWIDLGGQYDHLGRYDDARYAYLEASEVNPAGALALLNLGALDYRQGEREQQEDDARSFGTFSLAREWLEHAVELNPVSAEARFFLGATLYRLDSYAAAEDALQRALALDENHAQARFMLINVYTRQQRYGAALEHAVVFLRDNPDAPEREVIERVRTQLEEALGHR
jgi:tetratricopeptide (TPR) repeat protein